MSIQERISQVIDKKGITAYRFCKDLGLSLGYLDKRGAIGTDKYLKIIEYFPEISPEWLLTGKGEMIKNPVNRLIAETTHTFNFKTSEEVILPLLPINAAAGVFTGDVQVMEYECERYVVPMFREATFLIPVLGDSMYPTYNNGDVIACRKLDSWSFFQFGKVYVIYTSQGVLVKRIKEGSNENSILIISDNCDAYPSFELDKKELLGVAVVIGGLWLE